MSGLESIFLARLPTPIRELFRSPSGTTLQEFARHAVCRLEEIEDDQARSHAGRCLLHFLRGRGDSGQRSVVERALAVMDRFPHYPRPRAEVARRALHILAEVGGVNGER